jgi:PcRGLX-like N-terminal RIFT barrel domain
MASIPCIVRSPGPDRARRRGEPVTFGVPLPRGAVQPTDRWTIHARGAEHEAQTREVDRWSDGSVRWMLVDARIDVDPAAPEPFELRRAVEIPPPHAGAIAVVDVSDEPTIATGAATFVIRRRAGVLLESRSPNGDGRVSSVVTLTVLDREGAECDVSVSSVSVDERGPLRASVALAGAITRRGEEFLLLRARWDFYAGLPTAQLRVTLTNPRGAAHPGGFWDLGDPGSVFVKDVSLTINGGTNAYRFASVDCSVERGAPFERLDTPVEIYQDSSGGERWDSPNHVNRERRVPNRFRGYRLTAASLQREGSRATPIVAAATGSRVLAVSVPYFWENFPKALEVTASSVVVRLFPQQYADVHEIQPGEQKTHGCAIAFGRDTVTESPLEWTRSRSIAAADPEAMCSTGAVPFLALLEHGHRALVDAAVEGTNTFVHKREVVDQYGWRHFGEIYGDHEAVRHTGPAPLVSHYNNQYDALAGFLCQFFRTGDTRWWTMADELAAHVIDIDIYHTDRDKWAYNHGLFWHTYHYGDADTATHRTYPRSAQGRTHGGGPSADHNYTTGLMLYHFMTGDRVARQTVIDCGQYVIDMDDGRKAPLGWLDGSDTGRSSLTFPDHYGPGRAAANSLNALLDAYRLSGERRFIDKAERLLRRVFHPTEDIGRHQLDDPERRWFYTMFLQSVGKYLNEKVDRGELDAGYAYARASLLHYARWMAEHEYPYLDRPEKLEFPTETWSAQDIRKSDVFCHAALHASGAERARFLERAAFFHRHSVDALSGAPTRTFARPVVVLLTSGLMYGWMLAHPDAAAPPPANEERFAPPVRFVPRRERVKRRLIWLGAIGATLAASAVLYVLL